MAMPSYLSTDVKGLSRQTDSNARLFISGCLSARANRGCGQTGNGLCAMTGGKQTGMKTLNLVKGSQQFCFRYEVGQESQVLQSLIDMVNRRDLAFDWFDAAVLSHQLGQHLAKELKGYLPKKAA